MKDASNEQLKELNHYLLDSLASYAEIKPIERKNLMAVLANLLEMVYVKYTPCTIPEKLNEIDRLCNHLKILALQNDEGNG